MAIWLLGKELASGVNCRLTATTSTYTELLGEETIAKRYDGMPAGTFCDKTTPSVADGYGADAPRLFLKGDESATKKNWSYCGWAFAVHEAVDECSEGCNEWCTRFFIRGEIPEMLRPDAIRATR